MITRHVRLVVTAAATGPVLLTEVRNVGAATQAPDRQRRPRQPPRSNGLSRQPACPGRANLRAQTR